LPQIKRRMGERATSVTRWSSCGVRQKKRREEAFAFQIKETTQ
jgi:hypothetical protein